MVQINALVPELECLDFDSSVYFYTNKLGFEAVFDRPESKFTYLALGAAQLMLKQANGYWQTGPLEPPLGRGLNLQITVEVCGPLIARIEAENVPLFRQPETTWYQTGDTERGQTEFLVQDPDGYLLRFGQFLGERPALST